MQQKMQPTGSRYLSMNLSGKRSVPLKVISFPRKMVSFIFIIILIFFYRIIARALQLFICINDFVSCIDYVLYIN